VTSDSSTVVFSQSAGAGSVTGLGTATASSGVVSLSVTGNVAASVTIQAAKQGGGLATATSTFTVTAGPISTATSTIGASPSSITANGSSTTTLTVQAKDANGNNLTAGGSTIKLSTTDGTFPSSCSTDCTATDNGNGTYTLTLTSSTTAHAVTISGKVGAAAMTNTAGVTFTPGTATQLVFTTQPASATAGSAFGQQPVVKIEDANGNVVTSGADSSVSIAMSV